MTPAAPCVRHFNGGWGAGAEPMDAAADAVGSPARPTFGLGGLERAHAVHEHVAVSEMAGPARICLQATPAPLA
jgi:hypothetical protein